MKTIKSDQLIDRLEERVEKHLHFAIGELQNFDNDFLLAPEPDGGWSIAQCLWHLNSYGEYYLPRIASQISQADQRSNNFFKSTWFGQYCTKMMEPESGKMKMKAFKNHTPQKDLTADEVVAEFIHQQEELLRLLALSRKVDLNKIKIPISISKWIKLKLGDLYQFLIAHDARHMQQIHRVKAQLERQVVQ